MEIWFKSSSLIFAVIAPWDAEEYGSAIGARSTGQHLVLKQQLASRFLPVDLPKYTKRDTPLILTTPLVIVDRRDCIICWYLPGVLTENRQVGFRLSHPFPRMYKQYECTERNYSVYKDRRISPWCTEGPWEDSKHGGLEVWLAILHVAGPFWMFECIAGMASAGSWGERFLGEDSRQLLMLVQRHRSTYHAEPLYSRRLMVQQGIQKPTLVGMTSCSPSANMMRQSWNSAPSVYDCFITLGRYVSSAGS